MLWLALHFPHLSLDGLLRGRTPGTPLTEPLVICESHHRQQWVHDRNRVAADSGIERGMDLSAALSLNEHLRVVPRDAATETTTLEILAAWAGQFTPTVCVDPPDRLLLEIAGSLKLFGGLQTLRSHIARGLRALGYRAHMAAAPTPAGATLLAHTGEAHWITDNDTLHTVVRALPITALIETDTRTLQALHGMGLRTLDDCLRLPRKGLARRLGPELMAYLDKALGRRPDPREPYIPPARFHSRLQLPSEVTDTEALIFAGRRLLSELSGFLLARGSGVQELTLELLPHQGTAQSLHVGLVTPARDVDHLLQLLRERLERCTLNAPVETLELRAERLIALPECNRDLFTTANSAAREGIQLIEHLRARLGDDAVSGLSPHSDHRPEQAWRYGTPEPGQRQLELPGLPRPLWLLENPAPLQVTQGLPWLDGRLTLERGPERIESGWWDGADAARDYFIAQGPGHERLWIYRELRKPHRWFLHGIFG